jgi:lipoprotein-anchoring transpeptidase ErfK/SrfK
VKRLVLVICAACVASACGSKETERKVDVSGVLAAQVERCTDGELLPLGSARVAYVGVAKHGAVAFRRPGGPELERFGPTNVNDYPTVFGVVGATVRSDCTPRWYRVELPIKPNGVTGYVRASALEVQTVETRIVVDVSDRELTLYEAGKVKLRATVAVGSPATPTPTGRFYVNQRLIPTDTSGPFGPGAVGISAFSNVLTGWAQGGPVAIHGTNQPWSIGRAVSNGCIRLPNATLKKVFAVAYAGTPVIIRA